MPIHAGLSCGSINESVAQEPSSVANPQPASPPQHLNIFLLYLIWGSTMFDYLNYMRLDLLSVLHSSSPRLLCRIEHCGSMLFPINKNIQYKPGFTKIKRNSKSLTADEYETSPQHESPTTRLGLIGRPPRAPRSGTESGCILCLFGVNRTPPPSWERVNLTNTDV